ncbi:MAG: PIN domain-containing protein [Acidobacteriia bacterium]|nr:PIN domain-containing protein [Terriglobia bacterium]
MKPTLLDTGAIVALLDRSEHFHERAVETVEALEAPLVTCEAVIAESCYLLRNLRGAAEAVLENVATGVFQIPFRLSDSATDVQRIIRKYSDLPADFADACLIYLAGELRTGDVLTLDKDFAIYRWGANRPFRPLIALQ